jgi:hypothetical protein
MSGFSESAIDTSFEEWSDVQRYNACLERLIARRKNEVAASGPTENSKAAWKCAVLQQSLLYRATSLASGCAEEWNAGNVLCSILAARALVETIALSQFIADEFDKRLQDKNVAAIEELATQQLFSTRNEKQVAEGYGFQARSVLTFVDKFNKKVDGVSEAYHFLSEFCHPNASGHLFTYGELDKRTGTVRFHDAAPRVKGIQTHVVTSFMLTMFMERIMDVFDRIVPLVAELDGFSDPWINEVPESLRKGRTD